VNIVNNHNNLKTVPYQKGGKSNDSNCVWKYISSFLAHRFQFITSKMMASFLSFEVLNSFWKVHQSTEDPNNNNMYSVRKCEGGAYFDVKRLLSPNFWLLNRWTQVSRKVCRKQPSKEPKINYHASRIRRYDEIREPTLFTPLNPIYTPSSF